MTSSLSESSRVTTSMEAPWSSSPANCSRTCLRASWRAAMCALPICSTTVGPDGAPSPTNRHHVVGHAVGPHLTEAIAATTATGMNPGLDGLGQALPGQVRAPRDTARGRGPVGPRSPPSQKVELGRPGVGHGGDPVDHADDSVRPEGLGLLEHAPIGRAEARAQASSTQVCSMFWPQTRWSLETMPWGQR